VPGDPPVLSKEGPPGSDHLSSEETMRTHLIGRVALATVAAALLAAPLQAQRPGAIEIGVFGRYTLFDNNMGLKEAFGGGARLGAFLVPNLSLEAAGAFTPVKTEVGDISVKNWDMAGRLIYHLPIVEQFGIHLGAGYMYNIFTSEGEESVKDHGPTGLFGFRIWATPAVSIRGDAFANYIPSPDNLADQNFTWGGQLGLSYTFGAAADADKDGVSDANDACPDTPDGVVVDARGCPVDTDRDGVADFRDTCPNTPQGAPVDVNGCVRDGDQDGVRDDLDRCANTPQGESVDAAGCPPDADKDGVADARDRCADTPAGVAVTENGCPRDSDGDGVADNADRCANTPRGATVDATGCPQDGDGDGVPNGTDKCPTTAAGARVDATGCPVLFEENVVRVVLQGVTFATNSAELTDGAKAILNGVAESLVANPTVKVEVGGHTDITGSRATNTRLSQARAESVMAYLISKGVAAGQLTAKGFGPDEPVADNATREGRAQNRRVELKRVTQ
jgi:outer membrane protein OmpA-like peptidoglycan-associated protein